MSVLAGVSLLSLIFYLIWIALFSKGWNLRSEWKLETALSSTENKLKPSVIIAFKNEQDHLSALIDALLSQSYSDFELIWVNDNSTDNSVEIVETSLDKFTDAKLLHSPHHGKKSAQKLGIEFSNNDFIITTDADCIPRLTWVEGLISFQIENQADMIIAPVSLIADNKLMSRVQAMEFAVLVAVGIGAAALNKAIFCNAANMAFTKKAWLSSQQDLIFDEPSGDDVFLLHSIKRRQEKIAVLKSPKVTISTHKQPSFKAFIRQRTRWAAKSSKYKDKDSILTAFSVGLVNLMFLVLVFMSFYSVSYLYFALLFFLMKFIAEYSFIHQIRNFFKLKKIFSTALFLAVLYPIYTLIVMVNSLFWKKGEW